MEILTNLTEKEIKTVKKLRLGANTEEKILTYLNTKQANKKTKENGFSRQILPVVATIVFCCVSGIFGLLMVNDGLEIDVLSNLLQPFELKGIRNLITFVFWAIPILTCLLSAMLVIMTLKDTVEHTVSMFSISYVTTQSPIVLRLLSTILRIIVIAGFIAIGPWGWLGLFFYGVLYLVVYICKSVIKKGVLESLEDIDQNFDNRMRALKFKQRYNL